jgi:hypothetical protein
LKEQPAFYRDIQKVLLVESQALVFNESHLVVDNHSADDQYHRKGELKNDHYFAERASFCTGYPSPFKDGDRLERG